MKKNIISSAILLALSPLVVAESATELAPINVYSAYATTAQLDQTASSVTVLTEKDFTQRNATYVSDVLKTVPSIAFTSSGGRGTLTSFYVRGARSNHVAVVIDGVKVNAVSGGGFDFGALSLNNVERIEVLRGEQSALWGSDAMGGVIYITTKNGLYKDKPFNVDFDFGVGSNRTLNATTTISGYHNGFYYAVNGNSQRTNSISAFSADKFTYRTEEGKKITSGGAVERDKFHRDSGSLRLGYDDNNKGIELLASRRSQTARYDGSLAYETASDDRTQTRETLFKLSGYVGSDQDPLKQKISLSQLKTDSETFSSWGSAYVSKKRHASYQLDINFDREGAITQGLSLLAEYQKSLYNSTSYNDEKSLTEKSLAAEYRLFTENKHSLSISGRFTDNSTYKNAAFTGRIAGNYSLTPNLRLHASFGSAIQNPTLIDYYGYFGTYKGNPDLKPAKSVGGELGFFVETNDKQHNVDVTYFARNVKDLIASNATYTSSINLEGTSKIRGVEIAYNGKLNDQFSVYANYTYTLAKDSKGIELIRFARHTANLGAAYQITNQLGANVNLNYVGKRVDTYYDPTTFTSSRVKLPAYTLVNLGVNYQMSKNLNLYANLNNLFDKRYEHTLGYGQYGRNFYIGLKGNF